MSELKTLVPPLELCKKIPAGEFADSMYVHLWISPGNKYVVAERSNVSSVNRVYPPCSIGMKYYYPAPTTDEILDKCKDIPGVLNPTLWWQGIWKTDCAIDKSGKLSEEFFEDADLENLELAVAEDKSAATAALKLCLKLKGIEYGK